MRKFFTPFKPIAFLCLVFVCSLQKANAQNLVSTAAAQALVQKNAAAIGISSAQLSDTRISDAYYDQLSGATLVYLQQTFRGIDVYNTIKVLAFKNGKLISAAGAQMYPIDAAAKLPAAPALSAADAVRAAAMHLQLKAPASFIQLSQKPGAAKETEFGNLGIATNNIKTKLIWEYPANSKQLTLSWHVEIQPVGKSDYWVVKVNASNGLVIGKDNYTVNDNWGSAQPAKKIFGPQNFENNFVSPQPGSAKNLKSLTTATYRVVRFPAESPIHPGGAPALHTDPWTLAPAGSNATTLKWNDDGTHVYEYSRGNNVLSQEDSNGNNGNGKRALSSTPQPSLTFDYLPNFTTPPTDSINRGFALTNLFYWNNIMHDVSYLYGFDEVSGNFQQNNLGRGGLGNDYVFADGQDGSGTNNANFGTPPDGSNPRMQMYLFTTASPELDGDVDNGVIAHEYTHGISNRLTGGPSNTGCLGNAEEGGEGWSDYFAIMVTTNWATAQITDGAKAHPIGTYVLNQPITGPGIRTYPYSTDMSINPWTYAGVASSGGEVHNIGEIWCVTLWDMTWAIIQTDGINPDLYNSDGMGGNSVALKLVTEGLKLQKCSPGFLDARDAILKADTLLYAGKYSCTIWSAFARRGMGVNAKEGSSNSTNDQTEDFTSLSTPAFVKHADKADAAQGEPITYTLHLQASQCSGVSNYSITDTLSNNVTYVSSDGTYNAGANTVTISGINLAAGESHDYTITVKTNLGTYFPAIEHINEPFAGTSFPSDWKNNSTSGTAWTVSNSRSHSTPNALFAEDVITPTNEAFETKNAYPLKGISLLSFWHYYDVEPGYDGGVVEISTDDGTTWQDAGPYMTVNGYNGSIDPSDNDTQLKGRHAFTANSGGFIQTTINLTSFAGKNVKLRFLFATDVQNQNLNFEGWYLDDIILKSEAAVYNLAQMFDNNNQLKASADTLTTINSGVFPVIWGPFTAVQQGKVSLLQWKTLQELNTEKFAIERSVDGNVFTEIASLPAAGFSNGTKSYQYTDGAPLSGNNYYRLRQVDKDGRFTYSEVRLVNFTGLSNAVIITPNPATDRVSITIGGNTKSLKVYLMNTVGQQVKTYTMNGQYMQINLPHLAAGVYYIKIEGEGINTKQKLVIQ